MVKLSFILVLILGSLLSSLAFAVCPDFGNQEYFCEDNFGRNWTLKFNTALTNGTPIYYQIQDVLNTVAGSSPMVFNIDLNSESNHLCNETSLVFGQNDLTYIYVYQPDKSTVLSAVKSSSEDGYVQRAQCRMKLSLNDEDNVEFKFPVESQSAIDQLLNSSIRDKNTDERNIDLYGTFDFNEFDHPGFFAIGALNSSPTESGNIEADLDNDDTVLEEEIFSVLDNSLPNITSNFIERTESKSKSKKRKARKQIKRKVTKRRALKNSKQSLAQREVLESQNASFSQNDETVSTVSAASASFNKLSNTYKRFKNVVLEEVKNSYPYVWKKEITQYSPSQSETLELAMTVLKLQKNRLESSIQKEKILKSISIGQPNLYTVVNHIGLLPLLAILNQEANSLLAELSKESIRHQSDQMSASVHGLIQRVSTLRELVQQRKSSDLTPGAVDIESLARIEQLERENFDLIAQINFYIGKDWSSW